MAEAYDHLGQHAKAVQQLRQVLNNELPSSPEYLDLLCRLADSLLRQDRLNAAEAVDTRIAAGEPVTSPQAVEIDADLTADSHDPQGIGYRTMSMLELDVLAALALRDVEQAEPGNEVNTSAVLAEVCEVAPPALRYLHYREEHLRRCLLRIFSAPPRSTERQHFRLAALRECISAICRGGGCSPLPYEAAVWLLEEEEEIKGGQVTVGGQEVGGAQAVAGGVQEGAEGHMGSGRQGTVAYAAENFARRMMHQFPTNPTARALLAMTLRRHAYHEGRPVSQAHRRLLERLLADALEDADHVDCASAFKALAELQYENRAYQTACDTAVHGLHWLQSRRKRGHEALTQVALGLRLVLAKSLRRLHRLDEAEPLFKALVGWVTEGEAGFADMCGSAPQSIHQQALRGIALVQLERGDKAGARAQYERILGKAALGRGPAEHWAHADYGWLLYQDGDLQGARMHLEQAVAVAESEGCAVTDSQLGEHRYRLGEVYWKMRGRYRSDKQFAYQQVGCTCVCVACRVDTSLTAVHAGQ